MADHSKQSFALLQSLITQHFPDGLSSQELVTLQDASASGQPFTFTKESGDGCKVSYAIKSFSPLNVTWKRLDPSEDGIVEGAKLNV